MREHAVAPIKPAIRPPGESIQRFMRVLISEAIEENLGLSSRLRLISIFDRNKHQIRRGSDPYTTKTNFKAADQVQPLFKNRAPIKFPVPIRVLKNENAILALSLRGPNRIRVSLGDP